MIDPNVHDRFVLRQKLTLAINRYVFSIPDGASDGVPFCFVEQKRFKFKEDIGFFADQTKTQPLMRILARQRFDPKARYDITTAAGLPIGPIQKVFGASLLRSTYARRWKLGDVYDIDASADTEHVLDRRLLLAATVGMDALQAR